MSMFSLKNMGILGVVIAALVALFSGDWKNLFSLFSPKEAQGNEKSPTAINPLSGTPGQQTVGAAAQPAQKPNPEVVLENLKGNLTKDMPENMAKTVLLKMEVERTNLLSRIATGDTNTLQKEIDKIVTTTAAEKFPTFEKQIKDKVHALHVELKAEILKDKTLLPEVQKAALDRVNESEKNALKMLAEGFKKASSAEKEKLMLSKTEQEQYLKTFEANLQNVKSGLIGQATEHARLNSTTATTAEFVKKGSMIGGLVGLGSTVIGAGLVAAAPFTGGTTALVGAPMVAFGLSTMGYSAVAGVVGYGTKAVNNHYYGAHGAAAWEWLGAGLNLVPAYKQTKAAFTVTETVATLGKGVGEKAVEVASKAAGQTESTWVNSFKSTFGWMIGKKPELVDSTTKAFVTAGGTSNASVYEQAVNEAFQKSYTSGYRGLGGGVENASKKIAEQAMEKVVGQSSGDITPEIYQQLQTIAQGSARTAINGELRSQVSSAFGSSAKMEFNGLVESTADRFLSPSKTPENQAAARTPLKTQLPM